MSANASTSAKRIARELSNLKDLPDGVFAGPKSGASLHEWKGSVIGPRGSVYEGGVFRFDIQLPSDYPFSPPKVTFATKIYHPNVNTSGGICLDILKSNWSPALSVSKVLLSISSLLTDPNPHDPLVPEIARLFLRDRKQFDSQARQWTRLYATPPPLTSRKTKARRAPSGDVEESERVVKRAKKEVIVLDDGPAMPTRGAASNAAPSGNGTGTGRSAFAAREIIELD